ncbi:FHA domain-containing protein [Halomicronema sp. CCY15110]|uniref:FHA domain-containing protein n=1 Tax=Halomicronema sp. CCY15110 TaxID=2767773 RepID=UPI001951CCDB|nr:FHA domain-containing protein [Halomicronema sp. CCY15110]
MITLSLLHPLNKKPVQHWTFEEDSVIRIGRSTENQVVLYSAVVSRHHVELRQTDAGWEIVNLGTNGTYLDGKRVAQAAAEDGMVIRLARSGPNIQINISQEAPDSMSALRKLQTNVESRTKVEFDAAEPEAADVHPTRIDPEHRTTSESPPSVQS